MRRIQRTLLIVDDKKDSLIYGHSIDWILSDLDYTIEKWKTFSIGGISVYFKDIKTISEISNSINTGQFDLAPDQNRKIFFNLPESEDFFIEQSYKEENFNPFIGLCAQAKVYFEDSPTSDTNPADYLRAENEAFEAIEEKFQINLVKFPHLLGTFTLFTPTRLEENFKGLDNDNICGYETALLDYFGLYNGALVTLESTDENNNHITTIELDNQMHQINCGFVPDKQETTVTHDGIIIYKSSFSLLKKINISTNIIAEKSIRIGEKIIRQSVSARDDFDV